MSSISGFGEDYEVPISKYLGALLAGQKIKPGFEVVIASHAHTGEGFGLSSELKVQNVSGHYVIASTMPKSHWEKLFMFSPEKKMFWA